MFITIFGGVGLVMGLLYVVFDTEWGGVILGSILGSMLIIFFTFGYYASKKAEEREEIRLDQEVYPGAGITNRQYKACLAEKGYAYCDL